VPEHLKQHRFQPGISGNPGGRPKGLESAVREAIASREFTDGAGVVHKGLDAVLARLLEMMFEKGTTPRDAVALAKEIFDRGFGRAKQTVHLKDDNAPIATMPRDPAEMTDEELTQARDAIRTLKQLAVVRDDTEH
jgi:hypothetical protein